MKNLNKCMHKSELSERIEELNIREHDPESLRGLALKLHREGYAPTMITQEFKRRFGMGVPLTIFSKQPVSSKSPKSRISAEKIVQSKINQEITAEANEMVTKFLKIGKLLEEKFGPIARWHGYEDTLKFIIEAVYPFYDLYHNHVEKVEAENRNLRSGMQRLMEALSPEAKSRLYLEEVGKIIQSVAIMDHSAPRPTPEHIIQVYIKVLWETSYKDTAAMFKDPAFWTKKFIQKAAGV